MQAAQLGFRWEPSLPTAVQASLGLTFVLRQEMGSGLDGKSSATVFFRAVKPPSDLLEIHLTFVYNNKYEKFIFSNKSFQNCALQYALNIDFACLHPMTSTALETMFMNFSDQTCRFYRLPRFVLLLGQY